MNKIKILLTTLNAKYIHSSYAIASISKYCKKFHKNLIFEEFSINNKIEDILTSIIRLDVCVVAFSCYIWNIEIIKDLCKMLKILNSNITIIAGGPEAFDIIQDQNIDISIKGEGELVFYNLCEYFILKNKNLQDINGIAFRQENKIFYTQDENLLQLSEIPFVYEDNMHNYKNKILYYETSRGCPYKCKYCLSSSSKSLRFLDLERVFKDLSFFLKNNVKQVKFIDRTFNCNNKRTIEIWEFLIKNDNKITNFHFEISADIINEQQIEILKNARPGLFQFEIGVQSTNKKTLEAIDRVHNINKIFEIVKQIKSMKNIQQHLDLIVGLPFESYDKFKESFDKVYSLRPDVFQIGFLKVLKQTKIKEETTQYGIIYNKKAPYEILFNFDISFDEILQIKQIEKIVDIFYNSNNFSNTLEYIICHFESSFEFYKNLTNFWILKGYHILAHKKLDLYIKLYEFLQEHNILNIDLKFVKNLLRFDILSNENIKTMPECFEKILDNQQTKKINTFYNCQNIKTLFDIGKNSHKYTNISKFDYDILEYTEKRIVNKINTFILFDYNKRDNFNFEKKCNYYNITQNLEQL